MEEKLKAKERYTKKLEAAQRVAEALSETVRESTTVDYKKFTEALKKVNFGVYVECIKQTKR